MGLKPSNRRSLRSSPPATNTQRDRDLGAAYAMKPAWTRTELTSVVRGSPMGKLLRRYWHPVGLAPDSTDIPEEFVYRART